MVAGDGLDLDALVGLKDANGVEQKVFISKYLDIGRDWQQVSIPLAAFSDKLDWSHINELSISFEHSMSGAGKLYIDDLTVRHRTDS